VSGAQVPALDRTMRSAESFAVHTSAVPPVQEPATLAQRTTATGDAATLEAITKPAGSPSLTSPSKEWSQRQHSLQEHLDALSAGSSTQKGSRRNVRGAGSPVNAAAGEDGSAARAPAPKSTPATAAQRAPRYTVRSGDTLTRIASAHYGSRSKSVIDAIFDANRSVLADRDSLRVNVELVLPAIPGAGAGSSKQRTLADAPARSTMRPAGKPSERFRWYQINKNDRYISIARAQLGDGGRWREIYELNKDKFPDPGRIREGVRIKLPLASAHRRRP
jgi:nucleoid-associated protein YgaU